MCKYALAKHFNFRSCADTLRILNRYCISLLVYSQSNSFQKSIGYFCVRLTLASHELLRGGGAKATGCRRPVNSSTVQVVR